MAYIVRDEDTSTIGMNCKSFLTSTEDPRQLLMAPPPNSFSFVKRNLMSEIHRATQDNEANMLPAPSEKETVSVYLRIKPRTQEESDYYTSDDLDEDKVEADDFDVVSIETKHQIALNAPRDSVNYKNSQNVGGNICHRFTFSKIYPQETDQSAVFNDMVLPKLKDFFDGRNQLLFTYGATSSGKTFTIQGNSENPGILPRALDAVFNTVSSHILNEMKFRPEGFNRVTQLKPEDVEKVLQEKTAVFRLGKELKNAIGSTASSTCSSQMTTDDMDNISQMSHQSLATMFPQLSNRVREESAVELNTSGNHRYSVWVSFAEIYNENIYDLLEKMPEVRRKGDKPRRLPLKMAEDRSGGVYIRGLKEIIVNSADEAVQLLMIGRENLQFAATRLNHHSSRSHCIFTLKLIRVVDSDRPHLARMSMLSFCDLAGSERIKKTLNTGERQKEAGNINTSLLVLGRCIKAIRHNQAIKDTKKHQMVPFRESKLTRLLQCFFTGRGKCSMVVNISQSPYLFDESLQVLKFAAIASKVNIEVIKEPEPETQQAAAAGKVAAKKARRQSQFSMMVLDKRGKESLLNGRGSIAWENPQLRSTLCPAPAASSTILEENEDEEEDGDETADADETANANVAETDTTAADDKYAGLMALIDSLKNELIAEKQKNICLEADLRAELCAEFGNMMVEIETNWEQRLQDERDRAADLAEWRLNKLEEAYKERQNQRKRQRREENDQDSEKLSELETKLKDKEYELEQLQKQVDAMKSLHSSEVEEKQKQQEDLTRQSFELSTLKSKVSNLEMQLAEASEQLAATNAALEAKTSDPKLKDLGREIVELKEKVSRLEQEKSTLKELLNQGGKDFLQKDEEVNELTQILNTLRDEMKTKDEQLKELEVRAEEDRELLAAANANIEEKELNIFELEEQLQSLQNQITKDNQDASHKWLEKKAVEQQISNLNDEIESLKSDRKKLRALLDDKEAEVSNLEQKAKNLAASHREAEKSKDEEINKLEREIKTLIQAENRQREAQAETQAEVDMLRKQIKDLNVKVSEADSVSKRLKEKQATIEHLELVVKAFEKEGNAVEALRVELDRKNTEKSDLEAKISKLEADIQSATYETERTKTQKDELMKHYDQMIKKMSEELSTERNERKQIREVMARNTPKKLSHLEQELNGLKDDLRNKVDKIGQLESETANLRAELAVKAAELEVVKKSTTSVSHVSNLEREVQTLREELKNKSEVIKNLSDRIAPQTDDESDREEIVGDLRREIARLSSELETHKTKHLKEMGKANDAIKMYKDQNAELVKRLEPVKSSLKIEAEEEGDDEEEIVEAARKFSAPSPSKRHKKSKTIDTKVQVSFEDSPIENEQPDESHSPSRKTPRRGVRVSGQRPSRQKLRTKTQPQHVSFADESESNRESDESFALPPPPSGGRARKGSTSSTGSASSSRARVLAERSNIGALSPLEESSATKEESLFDTTPANCGRKKLFNVTAEPVEFTPPCPENGDTSAQSVFKRSLRSRNAKK